MRSTALTANNAVSAVLSGSVSNGYAAGAMCDGGNGGWEQRRLRRRMLPMQRQQRDGAYDGGGGAASERRRVLPALPLRARDGVQ